MSKPKISLGENVRLIHKRGSETLQDIVIENLITSAGKTGVAKRINGLDSIAAFNYIAIGLGTTAATIGDTTLESEITTGGGSRAVATASVVTTDTSNDTAMLSKTFTFTSSFAITESGLFNAASGGTMLNRAVFSAINLISGDSLTVVHQFDID